MQQKIESALEEGREEVTPVSIRVEHVARFKARLYVAAYWLQNICLLPFQYLVRKIGLALGTLDASSRGHYRYDKGKLLGRLGVSILGGGTRKLAWLAGQVQGRGIYETLLSIDHGIPLLGFTRGPTTASVLEEETDAEGTTWVDFVELSTLRATGLFLVVDTLRVGKLISFSCVWVTGDFAGHVFNVHFDHEPVGFDEDKALPVAIYKPSWPLTLVVYLCTYAIVTYTAAVGLLGVGEQILSLAKYLRGFLP